MVDVFAELRAENGAADVGHFEWLGLPVSKDTFLRSVRSAMRPLASAPRVIGLDDRAWRRGQRYGTVICHLERRQIIDLLPDRESATVEAWLRSQLQIEVVARDRNGGYGGAVTRALPRAILVADRWHLGELPELGTICRRRIASLAGLAPHARESGTWRGTRRIWGGRRKVREALYIAALSASRRIPTLIAMRVRMKAARKAPKTILIAVARQFLVILNAMNRNGQPIRL